MKEQQLQAKIIKYLTGKGAYVVKVITASKAGVPDILACLNGVFYGVEVKVGTNKPSALQKHNLLMIQQAGGVGILAYSVEDVAKVISSNTHSDQQKNQSE